MKAWGGIGGLGLGLSLLWTEASKRGVPMEKVLEWVASKPAKQVGLERQKGTIQEGGDADFVIFDANKTFQVRPFCAPHAFAGAHARFVPTRSPRASCISRTGLRRTVSWATRSVPNRRVAAADHTMRLETEGLELTGAVPETYLRGKRVYSRDSGFSAGANPIMVV